MRIVSIVGKKNTGKTSLTVRVIKELTKRGYNVASIKHSHHSIEMDKENTDTWKHKQAGANLVVGVGSTTFFNARKEHDLNRILYLLKHFDDFDFVIIEGYKSYNYPKIITSPHVRDKYTIKEVNSFTITDEEVSELADLIEERGHDIIDTLFANNCGYNDGEIIAREIREGNLKVEDLDTVQSYLSIDDKVVGLNRFVSDYLKKAVLGIINTLNIEDYGVKDLNKIELIINSEIESEDTQKAKSEILVNNRHIKTSPLESEIISNSVKGIINSLKTKDKVKDIDINIKDIKKDDLENAEINIDINEENLEINDFTQGIVKETIYAIVKTLHVNDEIKEITVKVEE